MELKEISVNTSEQLRYWLIELLAWWEGHVNASDLAREFKITRQSASKSINQYLSHRTKK
ncbi:hypothetical protein DN062_04940 [Nitrincola tibetensis]|uniref:DNA-binding transcriptional repressor CapW winged helix-turn-helix domain-containing protein n=1 Tax=Nitrincola tibetensis TaxID=2219697 RepID=A0A364NP82_9GAMM|nr:hypothetical protein DN062_04940 [Nitrincola tibetensis]